MSTSWPEHPLDDVAGYAVGALDPDDARQVEAHLAACDRCQAELAAHRHALAALVPDEEPPPGLWDRIVAALPDEPAPSTPAAPAAPAAPAPAAGDVPTRGTDDGVPPVRGRIEIRPRALRTPESPEGPQSSPGAPTDLPGPDAGPGPTVPAPSSGAPPTPGRLTPVPGTPGPGGAGRPLHLAGGARRRRLARLVPAAAAAAVLVVASVAATLVLAGDDDGGPPEVAASPDTDELAQAAAQDPTRRAEMAAPDGRPVARLVTSETGAYVLFDELPPLGPERSYQLWSLDAAQPVSLGVLGDGSGAVAVAVPDSTVQVAISDAPAGGEPAPTGPIVATGSVQAV